MVEGDLQLVRYRHVQHPPAHRFGGRSIHVEDRMPTGVGYEQGRHVGRVAERQQLSAHDEGRMARRMARCGDRIDSGHDFGASLIGLHLRLDRIEHAPDVGESRLHAFGRGGGAGLIHPEGPFGLGHHDLGVGEDGIAFAQTQAVDVVAMEVADHDGVNLLGREAGGAEVAHPGSGCGGAHVAVPGVEKGELLAIIDDERGEGNCHRVGGQGLIAQHLLDRGQFRIADEAFERTTPETVVDGGDLQIADLVAVEAGCLGRCHRRCGLGCGRKACKAGGRHRGCSCDKGTTVKFHDHSF